MFSEDEQVEVLSLIKRYGYLKFIENIQMTLTNQKEYYIKQCNEFNETTNKIKENTQRKIYKIRRDMKEEVVEENKEELRDNTLKENELKVLHVPEITKSTSGNIIEILKGDSSEKHENEVIQSEKKKCSGEELKKIRKGLAIRKFYKK
jgi:hypothetical protein